MNKTISQSVLLKYILDLRHHCNT